MLQASEYYNEEYNIVVQLMPNCPNRGVDEINSSYKKFLESNRIFQISAVKMGWLNPWWSLTLTENSDPNWMFPDALKERSQDLPTSYCPTGAIWMARVTDFLEQKTFYGKELKIEPLDDWRSGVDIDDIDDLNFAIALRANVQQ